MKVNYAMCSGKQQFVPSISIRASIEFRNEIKLISYHTVLPVFHY